MQTKPLPTETGHTEDGWNRLHENRYCWFNYERNDGDSLLSRPEDNTFEN